MQELLKKRQFSYVMWTNKDSHEQNLLTLFPLNQQLQMEFVTRLQPEETLKKKLVGCNFDGASVMMGKKSGVAVQIQKKVPQPVVILHCVAHNLDAVKTVPYLETFHETIRQVFKFYYYSPKKRREVNAVSEILDENPAHFSSNIKKTRLLSSRHRALAAMEKILPVTVTHLEQVSSGKGEDAAKAKGILKQITTG